MKAFLDSIAHFTNCCLYFSTSRRRRISFLRVRPETLHQIPKQLRHRLPPRPSIPPRPTARLSTPHHPSLTSGKFRVHRRRHHPTRPPSPWPPITPGKPHVRHHRRLSHLTLLPFTLALYHHPVGATGTNSPTGWLCDHTTEAKAELEQ